MPAAGVSMSSANAPVAGPCRQQRARSFEPPARTLQRPRSFEEIPTVVAPRQSPSPPLSHRSFRSPPQQDWLGSDQQQCLAPDNLQPQSVVQQQSVAGTRRRSPVHRGSPGSLSPPQSRRRTPGVTEPLVQSLIASVPSRPHSLEAPRPLALTESWVQPHIARRPSRPLSLE